MAYNFRNIFKNITFINLFLERDVIADANILQGAIFHEDAVEDPEGHSATELDQGGTQNGKVETPWPLESRSKQLRSKSLPAAHRVNMTLFYCECFHLFTDFCLQR